MYTPGIVTATDVGLIVIGAGGDGAREQEGEVLLVGGGADEAVLCRREFERRLN